MCDQEHSLRIAAEADCHSPITGILRHVVKAVLCLSLAMLAPAHAQEDIDMELEDEFATAPDVSTARENLKRALPPGASRDEEIRYLLERERAAFSAGAGKIRLEVLRRLVELHKDTPEVYRYWGYLWREEWRSGNQQRAFEIGEQLVASNVPNLYLKAQHATYLASDYAEIGQRSQAWSAIERAERFRNEYAQGSDTRRLDRVTATVEMQQSRLLLSDGRYAEAETAIRRAREAVAVSLDKSRNSPERTGVLSRYQADLRLRNGISGTHVRLLSTVGRHVEAEAIARQALQDAIADQTHGSLVGYWRQRIALAKLAQRRYADALVLTDQAIDIYSKAGLGLSGSRVLVARNSRLQALIGLERWSEADSEYASMMAATADDAVGRQYVSAPLLESLLHAMTGRGAQALKRLERVVRFRARIYGERHPRTIEAKAVQAVALQAEGNNGAALATYRDVFGVLFAKDTTHVDTVTRGLRGYYLPLALQHFLKLVATLSAVGQGTPELISDAFVVADRLRESVVQQAIVDSAARALVEGNSELAALVRKEQDVRTSLRTAYNNVIQRDRELQGARRELAKLREEKGDRSKRLEQIKGLQKELQALRKELAPLDQEQRDLRRQVVERFPEYRRLVNPTPMRPPDIVKRLAPDEALVSVYSSASHSFVWAVKPGVEPFMHVAPVGAATVARDVAKLRATLELDGRAGPVSYDFATAHRIYNVLLEPAARMWAGQRVLTVVSSGPLGQIPFALLATKPGSGYENAAWLVNDVAIAHVASASAWASVRDAAGKLPAEKPFLGFGDPQFSTGVVSAAPKQVRGLLRADALTGSGNKYSAMPPLPETRDEIVAIAKALGADAGKNTFFGLSASRAQVMKSSLRDYRVIAFATHGMKAGDVANLSQPALAMAATQNPDESPFLTLDDVLKLKLAAELIVLSACNTASDDGASEEAISGLGRGFFFAGARSMLVTHWAVESRSAQVLVTSFFTQTATAQDKTSRAERLRQAQLEMIAGKVDARYRHPSFWAPYALIGDSAK